MSQSVQKIAASLTALISGCIFGLGLLISGMNNPAKVRGFLDIFGRWQPELIAVMAGAVLVFGLAFQYSKNQRAPWFSDIFHVPSLRQINIRLLIGAMLFGIGWGLIGLCPGPALVDLVSVHWPIFGFVFAMLLGNRLAHYLIGPAK